MRVLYSPSRRELGKKVLEEISTHHQERPFARGFLLVPEQQKASLERRYFEAYPENSLMLEEVLSFRRFALRLAELGGGQAGAVMSPGLQTYYLGRMLAELRPELQAFSEAMFRPSFLGRISEAIGDFLRYKVSPEMLLDAAEKAAGEGENLAAHRLQDYALLLKTYQERAMEGEFLPGDLVLDDLASRLERLLEELSQVGGSWTALPFPWNQYAYLQSSTVWIHGFGTSRNLTPQESRIVTCLNKLCHELVLTAESDRLPTPDYADRDRGAPYFMGGRHLLQSLQRDYQVKAVHLPFRAKAPAYDFHHFERQTDEARWVAGEIKRLLAEEGLEPSAIGVALADLTLAANVQKALRELAIPFYTSDNLRQAKGAFASFIHHLADFLRRGWDQEFLLPLLRNPYLGISQDALDELENFWLSRGMKGKLIWAEDRYESSFQPQAAAPTDKTLEEDSEEDIEEENVDLVTVDELTKMRSLRNTTLGGVKRLYEASREQRTVGEFAVLWLRFFEEEGLEERVREQQKRLETDNFPEEAEFEAKSWNNTLALLAEFREVPEQAKIPLADFLYYLEEALDQSSSRRIPATGNQVIVGSLAGLAQEQTDYLFIMGATKSSLPGKSFQTSLLSYNDRLRVNRYAEREVLPDNDEQHIYANQSHLYAVLRLPLGQVYLSFTGAAERQAEVMTDLLAESHGTLTYHAKPYSLRDPLLAEASRAWSYLQLLEEQKITYRHSAQDEEDIEALHAWLAEAREKVLQTWQEEAGRKISSTGKLWLPPDLVKELVGDTKVWSISILERYSACPFAYYANHLLKLETRDEWTPDAASYGTLIHAAMEEQQRDWQKQLATSDEPVAAVWQDFLVGLSEEQILDYFQKARERDPSLGLFWELGTAYSTRHKAARAALAGSLASVREYQQNENAWLPRYEEWAFGPETGNPFTVTEAGRTLTFRGRIDRVDLAPASDGQTLVRLVDYKSGQKRVSYEDLYEGLDLQLPVYLQAFETLSGGEAAACEAAYAPVSPTMPFSETKPLDLMTANEKIVKGLSFSSLGLEADLLHKLMKKSLSRANELVTRMEKGDFSAAPRASKPTKTPCRFCEYRSLCGLDRGQIRLAQTPSLEQRARSLAPKGQLPEAPDKRNAQKFYLDFVLNQEEKEARADGEES